MAKLTGTEAFYSTGVLHDIFTAGGLLKHSIRSDDRFNRVAVEGARCESAKDICDEIKFRRFELHKIDEALHFLAHVCAFAPLHDASSINQKKLTAKQLANILAAFCAEHEIFWDDVNTHRTTVEMDTYRKGTFGNACWNFKCFLSQGAVKKSTGAKRTRAASSGPRVAPTSGYKASGPKSGLIMGLLGKPGEKVTFSTGELMYVVVCDSPKTKKQYLFVDPVTYKADPNKIRLGDPSGWSACKLLFTSMADAETAINKIKTSGFVIPDYITDFHVEKQKVDNNGYFQLNTEVGPAYVKASKLNEAIEESLSKEEEATHGRISRFPEINDIDVYSEALYRYE